MNFLIENEHCENSETEKRLKELIAFQQAILDNTNYMIISTNQDGTILTFNQTAERNLGYKASEVVGSATPLLIHDPEEIQACSLKLSEEYSTSVKPNFEVFAINARLGKLVEKEWTYVRKDGSKFFVLLSITPLFNELGVLIGFLGVSYDLTVRKREEEQLRRSEMLSIVGRLAAGVAHEIRNPLTSIKGFIQLLKSQTDENQDYFNIMLSEIDRITEIVNELMMIAKPKLEVFYGSDLKEILASTIKLLDTQAIMKGIQIHLYYDELTPCIECDANQLKQVFINIIQNALEAMPNGGEIILTVKTSKDHVTVEVIDQGVGISKEGIAKIGTPFYTTKDDGTGLGLMVCYKIIENHKGRLEFMSCEGKGTTVRIFLPI